MTMKLRNLIGVAAATVMLAGDALAAGEISEFRIGILGGENAPARLRSNECVREMTEQSLGVPTRIFAPADYDGVIEGLLGGDLDMAWLGAFGYAKIYLTDPEAVEPVLTRIKEDGFFGYYAIGFARVDRAINSLADMKGKVFGFGDPNSTSGYLIPSIEIPAAGYDMEPGRYFKDVVFTGGHEQTILAVYNGDIDGGVTWADGLGAWEDGFNSGALRKAVDDALVDMSQLTEIWRSRLIPEGPIVLRKDLPNDVKLRMVGLLAGLPSMDPNCAYSFAGGRIRGLVPIGHREYETIVAARRRGSE